jgi:plastocyanin
MGIDHIYVAPPTGPAPRCAPTPPDATVLGAEFPDARLVPPTVKLTLARVGSDGRARATLHAAGPPKRIGGDVARVKVQGFAFNRPNLTIPLGARVIWSFNDAVNHDVTLAAGPVGFGSAWSKDGRRWGHEFDVPGTYYLQCSLHPAFMSQVVRVTSTRASGQARAATAPAAAEDSGILW